MVIHESTRLIAGNFERVWAGRAIEDYFQNFRIVQVSSPKQNPMFPIAFEI